MGLTCNLAALNLLYSYCQLWVQCPDIVQWLVRKPVQRCQLSAGVELYTPKPLLELLQCWRLRQS